MAIKKKTKPTKASLRAAKHLVTVLDPYEIYRSKVLKNIDQLNANLSLLNLEYIRTTVHRGTDSTGEIQQMRRLVNQLLLLANVVLADDRMNFPSVRKATATGHGSPFRGRSDSPLLNNLPAHFHEVPA